MQMISKFFKKSRQTKSSKYKCSN